MQIWSETLSGKEEGSLRFYNCVLCLGLPPNLCFKQSTKARCHKGMQDTTVNWSRAPMYFHPYPWLIKVKSYCSGHFSFEFDHEFQYCIIIISDLIKYFLRTKFTYLL